MALRADKEDDRKKSGLSGLQLYWQDASKKPRMAYRRWQESFQMAVMGKYGIEVNEIIREEEETQRRKELMGNMEKEVAEKRTTSLLLLSIGQAGRKT